MCLLQSCFCCAVRTSPRALRVFQCRDVMICWGRSLPCCLRRCGQKFRPLRTLPYKPHYQAAISAASHSLPALSRCAECARAGCQIQPFPRLRGEISPLLVPTLPARQSLRRPRHRLGTPYREFSAETVWFLWWRRLARL